MAELLYPLLSFDIKTLIAVLVWGNLAVIILIQAYGHASRSREDKQRCAWYCLAKFFQASGFFCLFFRGALSDIVTVHLGDSLLLVGFYLEALSILFLIQYENKISYGFLSLIIIGILIVFNGAVLIFKNYSITVFAVSLLSSCIFAVPVIRMLFAENMNIFHRVVSAHYLIFALLLLPRAVFAVQDDTDVLTDSFIQSLTFLNLVLLLVCGLSACLLLMKEHADKIIADMTSIDSQTGLLNRRSFHAVAQKIFERRRTAGDPLAVFFIDIDRFKTINETYGHAFGDEILVLLAQRLRGVLRVQDLSCRYGGEEFIVLLPGPEVEQASRVTARIMDEVRQIAFEQHPEFSFTVSIGVMFGVPEPNETLTAFIDKAGKALYLAKKSGRNRVVVYPGGRLYRARNAARRAPAGDL
ncbi:MAG: GGDEF domain-containing protein [Desulfovibrio sp.]|nr:GGDEF domain-containing protein [Desulfovibrio sp.]